MKRWERKEDQGKKRLRAIELRRQGHTYSSIGKLLAQEWGAERPYSADWAHTLVEKAIKDIYIEDAKDLVKIELENMNAMQVVAFEILEKEHYVISEGRIAKEAILDEDGEPIINKKTGKPVMKPIVDKKPQMDAINTILKIQERRTKLLGLDKPIKAALTDPEGTKSASFIILSKEDEKL